MKILFVCHGNICRSPMAEFVMKDLLRKAGRSDVIVESAAMHTDEIGNDIHPGTRKKLTEMGVPFSPRAAWLLTAAKAREYDFLIGMDRYNVADLRRLVCPEEHGKIHLLLDLAGTDRDVDDPWYTGDFDSTWDDVLVGCTKLLLKITNRVVDFGCRRCGACCRIKDGIVRVGDTEIKRIAEFLGMSELSFIERETDIAPDRCGLVLKSRSDGACVYLSDDNRCLIHPVKPDKCRTFPCEWTNPDSYDVCPALSNDK